MATKKYLNKNLKYKEWLDIWLEKERFFIKESTYATYTNIIENHLKPVLGKKKIGNIANEDLQNFIILKLRGSKKNLEKGLSLKTVKDMTVLLKSTLNAAIQDGLIPFQNFRCKFLSSQSIINLFGIPFFKLCNQLNLLYFPYSSYTVKLAYIYYA